MARQGDVEEPADLLLESDDPLANFDLIKPARQRKPRDAAAWPYVSVIHDGCDRA